MALVCVSLAWVVASDPVENDNGFVIFEDSDGSAEEDLGSASVVREVDISRNSEDTCQDTLCK